ncbi:Hypothetical protein, putative [Bodo saltans]|uniref:Uncharacterized protein n=1 Tax=Bodo saltans TaxID=75058 RepID=A0A0S4IU61_BODSA|nr:Hypothetical protein, putative [Bodo saltans]|eukprot:CUF85363.1 Hypothetical protein, putative [Bodo saltans]
MSDAYYARPVTVTDERMQEAVEKQAKQRALREALDTQIHSRGGEAQRPSGLTRAQQKRIELQQLQSERQQTSNFQQQPQQYQSNSLPPNFAFSSSISMGPGGQQQRTYDFQANNNNIVGRGGNGYDSNSLPPGILSNMTSPTAVRASLQAPNFAIAEVYAQQQMRHDGGGLHAPSHELSVPQSPRQNNSSPHEPQYPKSNGGVAGSAYHKPLTTSDMIRQPQQQLNPSVEWGGGGAGENVRQILRMAQQLTDDPPTPIQQQQQQQNTRQSAFSNPTNTRASQQVAQQEPQRSAGTPLARGAPLKREKSRERVQESRVETLQKELQTRQSEMQKMREKERGWEDQVKQLKQELKNARQKERDLSKIVQDRPQRAETAPNSGSISKLAPIDDPRRNGGERPTAPVIRTKGGAGPSQIDVRASQPQQPTRKDFNNAKVFQNETFRPITAPLEPIDDVIRSSAGHQHLPPLPDSLKMASFNTRKIAFGLMQAPNGGTPIPLSYQQLCEFVKSQVVTQAQADALWQLFRGEEEIPKKPSPPLGTRPKDPSVRRNVPSSPTYETYDDLEDDEDDDREPSYYEDDE